MVPVSMGTVTKHGESISLNVSGGSETSTAGRSQIDNKDFASALAQAIQQAGLFTSIFPAGPTAAFHLEVTIVSLQQPMFGFSMTATVEISWSLTRTSDHAVIWQKSITSSHTAKTGEAFAGVTRLRLATEVAARNNIQDAITQMSSLRLN